jgi:hypothetical protein
MRLNTNGRLERARTSLTWALVYREAPFQAVIADNYFDGYRITFTAGSRSIVRTVPLEMLDDCDADKTFITPELEALLEAIRGELLRA